MIKTSDNIEEVQAVKEKVDTDIARQRSKDRGGDDGKYVLWNGLILFTSYSVILLHEKGFVKRVNKFLSRLYTSK